jgi:hypothetical protein
VFDFRHEIPIRALSAADKMDDGLTRVIWRIKPPQSLCHFGNQVSLSVEGFNDLAIAADEELSKVPLNVT